MEFAQLSTEAIALITPIAQQLLANVKADLSTIIGEKANKLWTKVKEKTGLKTTAEKFEKNPKDQKTIKEFHKALEKELKSNQDLMHEFKALIAEVKQSKTDKVIFENNFTEVKNLVQIDHFSGSGEFNFS